MSVFLWVNGVEELDAFVRVKLDDVISKICDLEFRLRRLTVKVRKGREYLYEWDSYRQSWIYHGRVCDGDDRRSEWRDLIKALREERKVIEASLRSCVVRVVNDNHLLIRGEHPHASDLIPVADLVVRPRVQIPVARRTTLRERCGSSL